MAYTNFITIKDYTTTTPLWNGEELIIFGTSFGLNGNCITNVVPKSFQELLTVEDTTWALNYNRRKADVSYGGYKNQEIPINGKYSPLITGPTITYGGTTYKVFTPSKLFELILQPRTVYIRDEFLIRTLLSTVEGTSPAIYTSKGIPCALVKWSLNTSLEGQEVKYSLTFVEDKEI